LELVKENATGTPFVRLSVKLEVYEQLYPKKRFFAIARRKNARAPGTAVTIAPETAVGTTEDGGVDEIV
jgi:hypothetical protein